MTTEDGVARETTPAHLIDSQVLGPLFASAEMKGVFGDRTMVQSWLDAEVALVRAQADCGLAPAGAPRTTAASARSDDLDLEAIAAEIGRTSHPLVPMVRVLAERSGEEAR